MGYGRLGRLLASKLQALNMNVVCALSSQTNALPPGVHIQENEHIEVDLSDAEGIKDNSGEEVKDESDNMQATVLESESATVQTNTNHGKSDDVGPTTASDGNETACGAIDSDDFEDANDRVGINVDEHCPRDDTV